MSFSKKKISAVYILFAFASLTIAGDTHNMLLLLLLLLLDDDLTPEWFLGLYTGEKSEVDILTFFRLIWPLGAVVHPWVWPPVR